MLDWLLHPLTIYAFILLSAGLNLWLFVSLKLERAHSASEVERRTRALEAAVEEIRQSTARVKTDMARERDHAAPAPPPAPAIELPPGDLNVTRRGQALRLARLGESREKIAASLGIPLNEVDLLLKVQEIVTQGLRPGSQGVRP